MEGRRHLLRTIQPYGYTNRYFPLQVLTTMPELEMINENLLVIAGANQALQSTLIEKDRRLSQELEIDLAMLKALQGELKQCHDGVCALTWKPSRG